MTFGKAALIIIQIKMIDQGDGGPGHVQGVEGENRLRLLHADQPHAGMVPTGKLYTGEGFRVLFPITEHLAISIGPVTVADSDAVQAFLAAGIQFLNKGPAFLISQFAAVQALFHLCQLVSFCCFHYSVPF